MTCSHSRGRKPENGARMVLRRVARALDERRIRLIRTADGHGEVSPSRFAM